MALIVPSACSFAPSIVTRTGNPDVDRRQLFLRQREVDERPAHRVERRHRRSRRQVLADVDGADAEPARERRADRPCARPAPCSAAVSVVAVLSCASISSSCACEMTLPAASICGALRVPRRRGRAAPPPTPAARARRSASSSTSTWPSSRDLPRLEADLADGPRDLVADRDVAQAGDAAHRRHASSPRCPPGRPPIRPPRAAARSPASACPCRSACRSAAPLMPASRPMTTSKPAATSRYRFQRPGVATGPKFKVPPAELLPLFAGSPEGPVGGPARSVS